MKRLHTLTMVLALTGIFILPAATHAQTPDEKKVVIIRKNADQDGRTTVRKIVAKGDEAEALLQEISDENGEVDIIRLKSGESMSEKTINRLKGIDISEDVRIEIQNAIPPDADHNFNFNFEDLGRNLVEMSKGLARIGDLENGLAVWAVSHDINCAALGVYVSSHTPSGVYVSGTIGESGAEEAGMQRGDIITFIDDHPTSNYSELHEVLAHYEPGDVVTVTFERDGTEHLVDAQLRAWRDLPSFADRPHAHVTCDKVNTEVTSRKVIVIKKNREEETPQPDPAPGIMDNTLQLDDFIAFPNPSDGKFTIQFSGKPVPTVVSVFDNSGKELFSDKVDDFSGYYSKDLDLTAQARGGAVLSVEQEGRVFTHQIILN